MILALAPPASSDIGACRYYKKPVRSDAEALSGFAGFAFDGIAVGGRTVLDARTGREVLVSPLTFRVIRIIKGRVIDYKGRSTIDYARLTPSGEILITVWDATYAFFNNVKRRLKWKVLHDQGVQT